MAELTWNNEGQRFFEVGVDRGVFYQSDGTGIAWNGLIAVKESPSGGESTPYYLDGVKYSNIGGRKEFAGSIEAYTYPYEFAEYDGWLDLGNGLVVDEQQRKPFGLSYRTLIGNDVNGLDHGYKVHVVYNVLVEPSNSEYTSISDDVDPLNFSWNFTTSPGVPDPTLNLMPLAHYVIDSRKTNQTQMRYIESYLYGTATRAAMIPNFQQMMDLFDNPLFTFELVPNSVTGIGTLVESNTVEGDLRGRPSDGLYTLGDKSSLVEIGTSGIYTLEI